MNDVAALRRRYGVRAVVFVIALHLGLLAWFAPPRVLFSKQPVLNIDYALHAYQVERARAAFRSDHALWSYDPQVLAGQPAGVVEDLTTKGSELFVIALSSIGIHPGFAFNLFIVLVELGMPLACLITARAFGLDWKESALLLLLWVLMWFFDSFMHWCWWIGMISWSADSYLVVLYVALFYRALETGKRVLFLPLILLGAALTLIHPFGVLSLLLPAALLYGRAFKKLGLVEHLSIVASALAALSTVFVWIRPLLRFRHYVGDADTFFRPTPQYIVLDALDLLKDWTNTGGPVRTMVRMLAFVAGGICLYRWHARGDRRVLPIAALSIGCVLLAYLSGYFWYGRQTQPYRHIGPAMLAAAVPAAVLLSDLLSKESLREIGPRARLLLVLALVLIVPRFVRTALYYFPEALPSQVAHTTRDLATSSLVGLAFEPMPFETRLSGPRPDYQEVRRFLEDNHQGRGRVLVGDWMLGEYLATATRIPILGGLRERNVPHVDANLFRTPPDVYLAGDWLARYLERYAVGFVVLGSENLIPLEFRRDLLQPFKAVEGFRIYRTRIEPSYFLRGSGRIAAQTLNTIEVADAAGDDVVLRFHYMETLACTPGCRVERFLVEDDRVGFIRVPDPPPSFRIYNAYDQG